MNIINIEHISKIYGEKVVFDDASFGIQEGDKIGIVGINGTGKSTLLKMIAGEETPDSGQIIRQNGIRMAYVPQNPYLPEDKDIRAYAFDRGAGEDWQVESNLMELGITDFDSKLSHLSGGQKRRVVLAKTLADDFDVLLLDEPTNHLDEEMLLWLEDYLKKFRGTLDDGDSRPVFSGQVYPTGFWRSAMERCMDMTRITPRFLELKAAAGGDGTGLGAEAPEHSAHGTGVGKTEDAAPGRTKQRARLDRLEALKNGKAPVQDQTVELGSVETRMGKKTIELRHVTKRFGGEEDSGGFQLYCSEKSDAWESSVPTAAASPRSSR